MSTLTLKQSIRFLKDSDVRALLGADALIDLMQEALVAFSAGEVVNPLRTVLYAGSDSAYVGIMPAFLPVGQALGTKLVTAFGLNKQRGLPSHFATIMLLDPATGALRGVVDGRYITEMRTAAISVLACRWLAARPIRRLAILGSGVQARGHIQMLDGALALDEVRIWSRGGGRDQLAANCGDLRARVVGASGAEDAVRGADAVILVTDSSQPVVRDAWIGPGTLVVSVGACRPDHREIDPVLLTRAWLIVDSRRSALAESGDVVQGIAEERFDAGHVRGEIGDVISGRVPPRRSDDDVVVFKSLGLAVEDVAAASLVLQLAEERGLGRQVSF